MMKVLVSDPLPAEGLKVLNDTPEFSVDVHVGLKLDELEKIIGDYDGLILRSGTKVTARIIEAAARLRIIGRAGVGVENIDVDAASAKGIVVMNTPGGNNVTTGEHTICLMLSLARHIPEAVASLKRGEWNRQKFIGVEVCNKTLGVIGLGNVGRIVAERALGLRMKVLGYDPFISAENAARMGVEFVGLDEIFTRSDFITVHVPLIDETRGLIDRDAIAKMKTGVRIINCARGGIVDEEALAAALVEGKVAGAALDVYADEPPSPDHPLIKMEQVVTTPHLGASTDEAQLNVSIAVAEQVRDFLKDGVIRYAVNAPSVSQDVLAELRPYLTLGEKLGSLHFQMLGKLPKEIDIECGGDVAQYDVAPISLAVLKGALSSAMGATVNYVNAPLIARERGVKVVESKSSRASDFASYIKVRAITQDTETEIEGAIFGTNNPRIVRINNFYFEAIPEGYIIISYNRDVPGVVGALGSLLGENGINIAGLELGREEMGGKAISFIHVDNPVPKEVMEKIRALANVISTVVVKL
jgi:D-3-phosphoglycerate dehydrogenase / 2-oxoglutarate reductase